MSHSGQSVCLISTQRWSNKYFQSPRVYWEIYTQERNIAVGSFESDMVWLQSKYNFSLSTPQRLMNYLLANFSTKITIISPVACQPGRLLILVTLFICIFSLCRLFILFVLNTHAHTHTRYHSLFFFWTAFCYCPIPMRSEKHAWTSKLAQPRHMGQQVHLGWRRVVHADNRSLCIYIFKLQEETFELGEA